MKAKWLLSVCIILAFEYVTAQTRSKIKQATPPRANIKILSKVAGDGVWLRWAPVDYVTWQLANKYGYVVERYTLSPSGALKDNKPVVIGPAIIKPYTKQALDELSKSVKEAAVLQELIYNVEPATTVIGPAALMKQNEEMENRFGITLFVCDLSIKIAEAAGLYVVDASAVKDERYIYKISVTNNPATKSIEPAVVVVDVKEDKPLQPFKDVTATFADKKVTLSWSTVTHNGVYTAYIIEKSEDGKDFKLVSDLPYVPMSKVETEEVHFVDSLAANDKAYYYQVRGITPFAEKGPASNVVTGTGKFDLTGTVILREVKSVKGQASIQWNFPVNKEAMIKGFVVSRASKPEGPFVDVTPKSLPVGAREMIDTNLSSSAYYQVKAVDAAGQEVTHSLPFFVHVEDNTPPAVPTELSGAADKDGIVILKWKPNSDNDLIGYRVFSSHDPKHEFVEVTRKIISTNSYSDTINTKVLNKHIYYTIVAVDNNFNASKYSTPCKVARPDLIAPSPPAFSKIEQKDNTVRLEWINSVSDDLSASRLYRVTTMDSLKVLVRDPLANWDKSKPLTTFVDNALRQGKTYHYVVEAYDSAENVSSATSRQINVESGIREDVTDLIAVINREKKIVTLKWNYDLPSTKCFIYRKRNNESFSLYQIVEGPIKEFTDKEVVVNNIYSYRVQLVLSTKVKTELSKSLKVPF